MTIRHRTAMGAASGKSLLAAAAAIAAFGLAMAARLTA